MCERALSEYKHLINYSTRHMGYFVLSLLVVCMTLNVVISKRCIAMTSIGALLLHECHRSRGSYCYKYCVFGPTSSRYLHQKLCMPLRFVISHVRSVVVKARPELLCSHRIQRVRLVYRQYHPRQNHNSYFCCLPEFFP